MGELHFTQKAMFLGYMVFKLLKVFNRLKSSTDRDSFKYKNGIETTGSLLNDIFREYYREMLSEISKKFDKEYYFKEKGNIYEGESYSDLIENIIYLSLRKKGFIVQDGKRAFKGQWGSKNYTSKEGIVQDLNRLSFNSVISHCRKLNLPLDPTAKVVAPRLLHGSQYGFIEQ